MVKDRILVQDLPVSYAEYNCLALFYNQHNMTVKSIAEKMDITPGGVTRIITSLENKGYIVREISVSDRREILVSLTDEGEKLTDLMKSTSTDIHTKVLKHVDTDDLDCMLDGIENLVKALDSWIKRVT